MSRFISPTELAGRLSDPTLRVVDVRWALDDDQRGEPAGLRWYRTGHLPGAVYLGWLPDWSSDSDEIPGQLAEPEKFARVMGEAGIDPDSTVVAYDDGELHLAARLAWAFQHYGHPIVQVLNGGYQAWVADGHPTTTEIPQPHPREFPVPQPGVLRATKRDVLTALEKPEVTLVDCRMEATYRAAGGHIPGAVRLPAPDLFEPGTRRLRRPDELRGLARAAGINPAGPTILYCGAGVSAAAAFTALQQLGFTQLRVYDGSWSEWAADPDTPKESHQSLPAGRDL